VRRVGQQGILPNRLQRRGRCCNLTLQLKYTMLDFPWCFAHVTVSLALTYPQLQSLNVPDSVVFWKTTTAPGGSARRQFPAWSVLGHGHRRSSLRSASLSPTDGCYTRKNRRSSHTTMAHYDTLSMYKRMQGMTAYVPYRVLYRFTFSTG